MVFLHALAQQEGGETLIVDSFGAAEHLRETDPDMFETLSSVAVQFATSGKDKNSGLEYHTQGRHPVIQ